MTGLEPRLHALAAAIPLPDEEARAAAGAALDAKTKPRGSLGRLERVAQQVAAIRGSAELHPLPPAIVVAAGDHGVATEGVSAYPGEVTAQMVANFARGGAAINVLARRAGARLVLVDAGVARPIDDPQVREVRIGPGTANFRLEPAMTRDQALAAIAAGLDLAGELHDDGIGIIGLGEMGIGNTAAAAALVAALLSVDPAQVCGRGTGLDDAGLEHKVAVVRASLARHRPDPGDAIGVLADLGGFEIAVLTGVAIGAAARRMVVLLDGFITAAAALVATRAAPRAAGALLAAHRSPEPGHRVALDALGLDPLLDLELRLGEGTGAALALPIVQAGLALASEMATFSSAGVADSGA